jgi:hypothetical protein
MSLKLPPRIYGRSTRESADKVRSAAHRKWIRTFACILHDFPDHECDGPIDCCHVKTGNSYSNRSKASDAKTIPMCRRAHDEQTAIGEARFELKYNISMNDYADEFAKASPIINPPKKPNASNEVPSPTSPIDVAPGVSLEPSGQNGGPPGAPPTRQAS